MKTAYVLALTLAAIALSGCCYHNNKSYRFDGGTTQVSNPNKTIYPHITIDSTAKQKRIPYLYASFVSTNPYHIHLKATSRRPTDHPLYIHSIKLSSDDQILFEVTERIELKAVLDKHGGFTTNRDGKRIYKHAYIYRHPLEDTLPYKRGRIVSLELTWEVPGITENQTHRASYKAASGPPIIHPLFLNSIME